MELKGYSSRGAVRDLADLRVEVSGQMSIKSTIAHGPNFHLYHEAFDEDYVYLELAGTKFEASYDRRRSPVKTIKWTGQTDEETSDRSRTTSLGLF